MGGSESATTKEIYFNQQEKMLTGSAPMVDMTRLAQAGRAICEIFTDQGTATGFFVRIPLGNGNYISGLMTNNHVLNENQLDPGYRFEIKPDLHNGPGEILTTFTIQNNMFRFTDNILDVTFIEVPNFTIPNYGSVSYLDIQEDIPTGSWITILQHPEGNFHLQQAIGRTAGNWGFEILHEVNTNPGSSGSPLLTFSSKVVGIHKASHGEKNVNIATSIKAAVTAIQQSYYSQNRRSAAMPARSLTNQEIHELKQHGLVSTENPHIFISPSSFFVTALYFYRSNHGWYWTPKIPSTLSVYSLHLCNWSPISYSYPIKAIGGKWDGAMPAFRNITLINWLRSTGTRFNQ